MDVQLKDAAATAHWESVLAHRGEPLAVAAAQERFVANGVMPQAVDAVLCDGGEQLYRDAISGRPDWAAVYGGHVAVALLAAEVAAFSSHLVSRASSVRSFAVDTLLEDFSAIAVAAELGVSRQKVYEIGRGGGRLKRADSEG